MRNGTASVDGFGSDVVTSPYRIPIVSGALTLLWSWMSVVGTCSVVRDTPVGSVSASVMLEPSAAMLAIV